MIRSHLAAVAALSLCTACSTAVTDVNNALPVAYKVGCAAISVANGD